MIFLDSTGFYGLVGLLVQCGLSWLLVGVFAVVHRQADSVPWFRHWLRAFTALAIALSAVSLRFVIVNAEWNSLFEEQRPATRVVHAIYLGGKATFLWLLLAGIWALRDRALPRWLAVVLVCGGAVGGGVASTIEALLLMQAPVLAVGMAWGALALLRMQRDRQDPGSRIVGYALLAWGVLWALYIVPLVGSDVGRAASPNVWIRLLRLTSFCDMVAEVALGAGAVAMVLLDAYRAKLVAVAERDRLRETLLRDEKLRAIGTLVSGVAHELNNPLTSVLGFAADLDADDPQIRSKAAQVVREQAERCAAIVQNLSLLSSQQPRRHEVVDVEELAARVVRGFAPQAAAAGVELAVRHDAAGCGVMGDKVGLERVLCNLVANALQASPRGTRVEVRTRSAGERVWLDVVDAGAGVPAWVAARLFEPFFTTKPPGQGVGLGLSMARALARSHGGDLSLLPPAPGVGAHFRVDLPVTTAVPVPATRAVFHAVVQGRRRVLLIDDETMVRGVLARQAELRGWHVTQAADGEIALACLRDGPMPDVVVCDLRMPGLSGSELHDRLAKEAPQTLERFIFITGDLASPEARTFAARCRRPLLHKPLDFALLFAEAARIVA